jgi:hypothetical protein
MQQPFDYGLGAGLGQRPHHAREGGKGVSAPGCLGTLRHLAGHDCWPQRPLRPVVGGLNGPAGACAQKVTVLDLGQHGPQNVFRFYAGFSLVFRGLSPAVRKTSVFFTETQREGSASKTRQKTRLKINVKKTGGAAGF